MHVAWLGKRSPFCGNVTYSREITNALRDRGHEVSFLHFAQEEETEDEAQRDVKEVPLPYLYKSQIYTLPTFGASKVLTQSLSRLRPHLLHASLTLSPLDFVLPEICDELQLPLISTFHPAFDQKLRNFTSGTQQLTYQLYAPFLASYDCTIVFSQIQRDMLIKLGVEGDRVAVIPNGVDVLKYAPGPSPVKRELGCDRLFVYVGRLAQEKNVEPLLKAWKKAKMPSHCKLAIVGSGPLKTSLQTFYGPEHGVEWMGYVANESRRIDILRAADVFVLPSLVEGLSLSLLEAMACGVACMATEVGADGEAIEQGAGIRLNPQKVYGQLRTLLPMLAEHEEITALLGQRARERVLERYTLDRNLNQLEALYGEILKRKRSPLVR
ncbi:glycosyltransferase family 4 protein [Limnothrix sp. FACHB-1083]|uniref:glycosyltransferase family 4 protein n=1 Tax=unclassified Limnothrix TaxID=2632864 RepID=UPI0016802788|nr:MULTISPECIES: glycosyltransferase family 4 protein [unclassified Limnothrix]MBD2159957.1 glycosyltransferase family 4 protein [Limnothrix sp. FACHB-1083]MBD2190657.1 glycosyltransferase family 4 protein [Limnothrix sp. FACHB-1088]